MQLAIKAIIARSSTAEWHPGGIKQRRNKSKGTLEAYQLFLLGIAHKKEGHRAVKAELVNQITDARDCCWAESTVLKLQKEQRGSAQFQGTCPGL